MQMSQVRYWCVLFGYSEKTASLPKEKFSFFLAELRFVNDVQSA